MATATTAATIDAAGSNMERISSPPWFLRSMCVCYARALCVCACYVYVLCVLYCVLCALCVCYVCKHAW